MQTVVDRLIESARRHPDQLSVATSDDRASCAEVRIRAIRATGHLSALDVGRGDVVAVATTTSIDGVAVIFGLQLMGAIPVVIDVGGDQVANIARLRQVRCGHVVTDDEALGDLCSGEGLSALPIDSLVRAREVEEQLGASFVSELPTLDDVAFLQLTSGTTGEPQAATITHRNLAAQLVGAARAIRATDGDIAVNWMPLHHDLGLVAFVFLPVWVGYSVHHLPPSFRSLGRWLELIAAEGATITGAPDFAYRAAIRLVRDRDVDLSSLRVAISGGEPVRAATIEEFESTFGLGHVITPCYGLGEATLAVTASPPGRNIRRLADGAVSCGPAIEGAELAILGDDRQPVAQGRQGEIAVRGEMVFDGYWNDDAATAEKFVDGWLLTGDVGSLDDDGELYVSGRRRAIIKRGGRMISSRTIEEAVDALDRVRRSAAVSIDDGSSTERLVVVVEERSPGVADAEIHSVVHAVVGFRPDEVVRVRRNTIPRTRNGKLRHGVLIDAIIAGELTLA